MKLYFLPGGSHVFEKLVVPLCCFRRNPHGRHPGVRCVERSFAIPENQALINQARGSVGQICGQSYVWVNGAVRVSAPQAEAPSQFTPGQVAHEHVWWSKNDHSRGDIPHAVIVVANNPPTQSLAVVDSNWQVANLVQQRTVTYADFNEYLYNGTSLYAVFDIVNTTPNLY